LIFVPLHSAFGVARNLSVNVEITAKIRATDKDFFKKFDVYRAAVREYLTALLFDPTDEYTIAGRFWGEPLSESEIVYAIARLEDQYVEAGWELSFAPRALSIVNKKGEFVGYVYTSLNRISMDRKKDGRVTVFRSTYFRREDRSEGEDE